MKWSYWEKRAEQALYRADQKAFHFEVNLLRRYQKAQREIKQSIQDMLEDAGQKTLTRQQYYQEWENVSDSKLSDIFDDCQVTTIGGKRYILKGTERHLITRKLGLERQIQNAIDSLRKYEKKGIGDLLSSIYEEEYYRRMFDTQQELGYAFDFTSLDIGAIRRAIDARWCQGENFSDRNWKNKKLLEHTLDDVVVQGIVKGEDFNVMTTGLQHRMSVSYHTSQTLVRTEVNRIYNLAANDSYAEGGVEQYRILATLDKKTSKICRSQDGKVYNVKDMIPGVNAPPFHPNCRTTTIPVVEWSRIETRAARNPLTGKTEEVPADMTYQQWYDKFVDPKNVLKRMNDDVERIVSMDGDSYRKQSLMDSARQALKIDTPEYDKKDEYAFRHYSRDSYDLIQDIALGRATDAQLTDDVYDSIEDEKRLHKVLSQAKTPEKVYVNRGLAPYTASEILHIDKSSTLDEIYQAYKAQVGNVIQHKAYMSTTAYSRKQSLNSPTLFSSRPVQYHMELPEGSPAMYIREFSVFETEEEVLIDKGQYFQVLKVEMSPGEVEEFGYQVHVFLKMIV